MVLSSNFPFSPLYVVNYDPIKEFQIYLGRQDVYVQYNKRFIYKRHIRVEVKIMGIWRKESLLTFKGD